MGKLKQSAYRVVVHGRVQGVGFRYNAQKKALSLGLTGWVRNCGDGTVEAYFEGVPERTSAFLKWLHRGPLGANVHRVDKHSVSPQDCYKTFNITY